MSIAARPGTRAGATPRTRRGPRPAGSRRGLLVLGGALLPLLLLAAWQLTTSLQLLPPSMLPAPATVVQAGVDLARGGDLGTHIAISVQRVLSGFALGAAAGLFLGAIVGLSRLGDILLAPTLGALRAVPSLAWVPLLMIWLKFGEVSKVTLVAIGAFFPVYTTVAQALRHVDRQLVEAGRAFGLSGVALFTTVQLPAVIPSVISGLRLALAQAWLFLVAAELLGASMGLGYLLNVSQANGRLDRIFLAIILLAVIGKLTDAVLGIFARWANARWA